MLLELNPFHTELFCIARPRVRLEARFFADFLDFGVFWGSRGSLFGTDRCKKSASEKSAKLSGNGSCNELGAGPAGSLKQEN